MADKYKEGDILRTPVRGSNPLYIFVKYAPMQRTDRVYVTVDLILKLENLLDDETKFVMPVGAEKLVLPIKLENSRLYRKCDHTQENMVGVWQRQGEKAAMHCTDPVIEKYLRVDRNY